MTYSLLLLTRYSRNGPSSRVRHYSYVPALQRAGFDITIAPFFDEDYVDLLYSGKRPSVAKLVKAYGRRCHQLIKSKRYDLLWIEKEALPWVPATLERALLGRRTYIVDYDDAWYLRYARHSRAMIRYPMSRKLEDLVMHATLVVVGNSVLADWADFSGARWVIELPSPVDLTQYPVLPSPDGPFTVGWIGTPVTAKYLAPVAEPLQHLQTKYGAKVLIIGVDEDFSLPGVTIERVPWREESEAANLARCHVGIAPLRDEPWEQGKCGLKLIQYMAAGRATVASPVGANKSIVIHGHTGFLASTPNEWIDSLCKLASDRNTSRIFGANGRQRVRRNVFFASDDLEADRSLAGSGIVGWPTELAVAGEPTCAQKGLSRRRFQSRPCAAPRFSSAVLSRHCFRRTRANASTPPAAIVPAEWRSVAAKRFRAWSSRRHPASRAVSSGRTCQSARTLTRPRREL